jgi:enterochelin esterase-like enzyme
MQPSDISFGVLMAVITLGAIAATALTWDLVTRFHRTRRVTALIVSQLLVVLTGFIFVNIQQTFYTTWTDLASDEVGGDTSYLAEVKRDANLPPSKAGVPVAPIPGDDAAGGTAQPQQLKDSLAAAEKAAGEHPGKGVVVPINLAGSAARYSLPGRLYLPAAYFDKATPNRRFPVIQFFSGYPSNVDIPFQRLHVHEVLDEMIAAGKMSPTIVVVAEQHPRRKHDSACVDAVNGGDRAETYLAVDVPRIIARELRVDEDRRHWTLMGFSTGGYCSVNLALRHSDRYGNAISLSGNMHPDVDSETGDLFGGDTERADSNNPLKTVGQGGHLPLRFFLFTSMQDGGALPELKAFAPKVRKPDTITTEFKPEGGHNSGVWRWALPKAFAWLESVAAR